MSVFILLPEGLMPLDLVPVAGKGQPLTIEWIGKVPDEVQDSVRGGGIAMLNMLKRERQWCHIPRQRRRKQVSIYQRRRKLPIRYTYFSCQPGNNIPDGFHGESGALAGAIAALFGMTEIPMQLHIGATGRVGHAPENWRKVQAVGHTQDKLQYAIDHLNGGIIFYPQDNGEEVPDGIRNNAQQRGIILQPVRDLDEVREVLFGPPGYSWLTWLCTLMFIALTVYLCVWAGIRPCLLARCQGTCWGLHPCVWARGFVWDGALAKRCRDATTSLQKTRVILHTQVAKPFKESAYTMGSIPDDLPMTDSDQFAFKIYATEPVYTYIYWGSNGQAGKRWYPTGPVETPFNGVHVIPEGGVRRNLRGMEGSIDIAVVIARQRCEDLENAREIRMERLKDIDTPGSAATVKRIRMIKRGDPR